MNDCDLLMVNVRLATMAREGGFGAIHDGALVVSDGRIEWVGARADLSPALRAREELDGRGCWVTPGLIDCHTHLVYAGNRAREFERRLAGASYEDISREGGGIQATVRATRAASEQQLLRESEPRLKRLLDEGVTTVEIKSGYGLDPDNELKLLRVARQLGAANGIDVHTTLLAAHALPPEYAGRAADYVTLVCEETIPAAARDGLADAVDAFCERIAFSPGETRRVFAAARAAGLRVKLHADQLSDSGGAALAAEFGALSADHLEYSNDAGIAAMANAHTVAVLLPGAFYTLRETRLPPVAALRAAGVRMAVATDCNPGTSPVTSLLLMLNMACTLFRLTPEEALAGVTRNAAQALGLNDRGRLEAGLRADLVLWDIGEPVELAYAIGANPLVGMVRGGNVVRWNA
ncbi:MAG: imidazolonepropionase [Pseudomonadota bacterium]|nr:imidazolonepropionase [Pseudomonadota bacterium]